LGEDVNLPVNKLCKLAGMSRQNFYKHRKASERRQVDEGLIRALVLRERAIQPRIGGLKLHSMLGQELAEHGINIGRDRFFGVLKNQGLLLERLPRNPKTTNSNHNLPVFGNLIKDISLISPNQVWVSDITYIRTKYGFMYLSLITDKFSRKVVGYYLSESLEASESIKALESALAELPDGEKPIHHSDRGRQYCSHKYVKKLKANGIGISMTEDNHCAENALAERVNGILKQEYCLNHEFISKEHAQKSVKEAIYLYNNRRLHRSLKLCTPSEVHRKAA
jgi:transposase InsO family protein